MRSNHPFSAAMAVSFREGYCENPCGADGPKVVQQIVLHFLPWWSLGDIRRCCRKMDVDGDTWKITSTT